MPPIRAGQRIRSGDCPPAAWSRVASTIANVTGTAWQNGPTPCEVTFVAPVTGEVQLVVGHGTRGDTNTTDRIWTAPAIWQGTNATGVQVLAPDAIRYGLLSIPGSTQYNYASRQSSFSGLTPGATYFARTMWRTTATVATTMDISCLDLGVTGELTGGTGRIRGRDTPASVFDQSLEPVTGFGNTDPIGGTPEVGGVFLAPTSGRVKVVAGGDIRDSSGAQRVMVRPQIFRGTSAEPPATMLFNGSFADFCNSPPDDNYSSGSRVTFITGLEPGVEHYVRCAYLVVPASGTATNTGYMLARDVSVTPLP